MLPLLFDLAAALALGMSITCAVGALSSSRAFAEKTAAHGRFSSLRSRRR
jgi:hypothetical protein